MPGTARSRAPGRTAGPVDERQLELVRKLLAKAESTTFEAEAETFTAAAQALMARHSIDAALLSATDPRRGDGPTPRRVWIERPYEREKVQLLGVVADANRCRTVWNKELGFVTVVGYAADLAAAEAIFTSLLVQATSALAGEGRRTSPFGGSGTRSFRQSFLAAYASRIGDRLRVAADAATADVLRDHGRDDPRGRGDRSQELVRVMEQRSEDVDAAVEALFPRLRFQKTRLATDPEGWQAGRRAADSATLHGAASTLERGA